MAGFLDDGLDEMAAGAHASIRERLVTTVGVGLIALAFEPWWVCAAWIAVVGGLDALSWFTTRDQYLGLPITSTRRLQHVTCMAAGVLGWTYLGLLFWRTDTAAGAVCAVIIWLSEMGFAQVYAYQSRAGYLIAGTIPAAGMLITAFALPNRAVGSHASVWVLLLVSVAFAASGARQTILARRRYEQATEDLRASEMSYSLLADNVTDVISLASQEGERLYVSPSIERVLGFSPGELLLTPNYTYLHPDDRDYVQGVITAVTLERGGTAEYRVVCKDGSFVWAETTFSRLNDGSGRLLAISRDVTHRKQLEVELREAVVRAEAAAMAKADFLANMTHELRTPLNAILGFSGVLKESTSLSTKDARHVGLIHDASATLMGVIGDVLDYSKLEAGRFELDPQPFEPAAMARSAAAIVADQAAAKGLKLTGEIDPAIAALVGDAPRLRQVLLNFLSNAVKFTREGAVELVLTHRMADQHCRLRVEVRDTGIGIPEDHIDAVFMRFTQADASVSRQFGGTGLGLAISQQIIEAMGGKIGATSVVGEGSTFWFEVELPLADEQRATPAEAEAGGGFDRRLRLLVAEDNAVNRELIATLLSPFDIEIETAVDGAEAVEAVSRGTRFDVILMDVQMPVMDGLTATRRIRGLAASEIASTPIIAMTANVLPEQIDRCREAGMDDHLGKPIMPARLLEALAQWASPSVAAVDIRECAPGDSQAAELAIR